MRSLLWIYSKLLYLYPRSYRDAYAMQMKQVLMDMLDDAPSWYHQLFIWMQVSFDLPVTIIQQNIIALGGHSMEKRTSPVSKRTVIIISVVLLVAAAVIVYEFGRKTLVPAITKSVYGNSMRSVYERESTALGRPSVLLAQSETAAQTRCTSIYKGFRVQIDCGVYMNRYALLPQGEGSEQRMVAAAESLESALASQGYRNDLGGFTNGVTVRSLVGGTYKGIDYSPDATYIKRSNGTVCTFQVTVAYSNPNPPAFNIAHSCQQTFIPFGQPIIAPAPLMEVKG